MRRLNSNYRELNDMNVPIYKIRQIARRFKRHINQLRGTELNYGIQTDCTCITMGGREASWTICPIGITSNSIIYSFGIGEDITFDNELIRKFGCRVFAFDPTPRSLLWLMNQSLPAKFIHYSYGLADHDGRAFFSPPHNSKHVSYKMTDSCSTEKTDVAGEVYELKTIMGMLKHEHVDILKIDIEGAEYNVINNIMKCNLNINQILVEFHHRFESNGIKKTKEAIEHLNNRGYRIFYISDNGEEYSFIKMAQNEPLNV